MNAGDDDDCVIMEKVQSPDVNKTIETKEAKSSGKKFKQTILCFKTADSNSAVPCISNPQPSKKRRLADAAAFTKSAKNAKNPVTTSGAKKSSGRTIADDDDKEVSSSCEMEGIHPISDAAGRHGNRADLRKFIYTSQQVEVSTTSDKDDDLAGENASEAEADMSIDEGDGKNWPVKTENDVENKENIPAAAEDSADPSDETARKTESESETSSTVKAEGSSVMAVSTGKPQDEDTGMALKTEAESKIFKNSESEAAYIATDDVSDKSSSVDVVGKPSADLKQQMHNCDLESAAKEDQSEVCRDVDKSTGPDSSNVGQVTEDSEIKDVIRDKSTNDSTSADHDLDDPSPCKVDSCVIQTSPNSAKTAATNSAQKTKRQSKGEDRLTRQKRKEELEQQKKDKKEQKEKERQEAKLQKEKEKQEKEKEKEEKKRQKEDERLKKVQQREEEKKKKEEAKLEEKKRKEEEKKKKDEEKQDKDKGSQKEKLLMQNFFIKTVKDPSSALQQNEALETGPFMPFEPKKGMRLAPKCRVDRSTLKERMDSLDARFQSQSCASLYLDQLKLKQITTGKSGKTWPRDEVGDVMVMKSPSGSVMKAKLFQFTENYRPAYYGTWRKRSDIVRGRRPFRKDNKHLDYEVDSDDEWEEEEPGESLSHSEGEEENEQDVDADDEDGFFVPHGYLSEGEGCEDDEDERASPEKLKASQIAKARNWEAEMSTKKRCEILRPICVGICWLNSAADDKSGKLADYEAVLFESSPIMISVANAIDGSSKKTDGSSRKKTAEHKTGKGINYISIPDAAIPDLIRLVHGNKWSIFKLVKEFQEFWRLATEKNAAHQGDEATANQENREPVTKNLISKTKLKGKIREIAVYERRAAISPRKFWYVNSDSLEKHGLSHLPVPNDWIWVTKLPDVSLKPVKKATGDAECLSKTVGSSCVQQVDPMKQFDNKEIAAGSSVAKLRIESEVDMMLGTEDEKEVKSEVAQKISRSLVKKNTVKRLGKMKTMHVTLGSIRSFVTENCVASSENATSKSAGSSKLTSQVIANIVSRSPLVRVKKLQVEPLWKGKVDSEPSKVDSNPSVPSTDQLDHVPPHAVADLAPSVPDDLRGGVAPSQVSSDPKPPFNLLFGAQNNKRCSDGSPPDPKRINLDVSCIQNEDASSDCEIVGVEFSSSNQTRRGETSEGKN